MFCQKKREKTCLSHSYSIGSPLIEKIKTHQNFLVTPLTKYWPLDPYFFKPVQFTLAASLQKGLPLLRIFTTLSTQLETPNSLLTFFMWRSRDLCTIDEGDFIVPHTKGNLVYITSPCCWSSCPVLAPGPHNEPRTKTLLSRAGFLRVFLVFSERRGSW